MNDLDDKIPFDMMGIMQRMHYPLAFCASMLRVKSRCMPDT